MDSVGVQDEGRVGDVMLPGGLGQRQAFLKDAPNGLSHGLGPPGFHGASFAVTHALHHGCVLTPAFLPHILQLKLVVVINRRIFGTLNIKKVIKSVTL